MRRPPPVGLYGITATPSDCANAAEKVIAQGFDALKFDPLPRPWRSHIPRDHVRQAVEVVKAIRTAVGPKVDLLLDIHRRLAPTTAIQLSREVEPYGIYWFEEPCPSENLEAIAEVRAATSIPVVTGEALYGRAGFRDVLRRRCADILNPDVSNCGGILELTFIAAAAEAELVAVSPHNYNSTTLALSATVQAAATMPNFTLTEYFMPYESFGRVIAANPLVPVKGYIDLPTGPGLGLDILEDAVRAHPAKVYAPRTFRSSEDQPIAGE